MPGSTRLDGPMHKASMVRDATHGQTVTDHAFSTVLGDEDRQQAR